MKRKIILILLIFWSLLIVFDGIRLKLDKDNDVWNRPIICIYEDDENEIYYGIGYSYEIESEWHIEGGPGLSGVSYATSEGHFKLFYIIKMW